MIKNNFDYQRLREDLLNYFGTAMINVSFLAINDVTKIEKASDEEILEMAEKYGIDLEKYYINYKKHLYY